MATILGVIGGSGIYDIPGLEGAHWRPVETPWGVPSDAFLCGTLNGVDVVFVPRHGRGHVHAPESVPYRANIDALKRLGVSDVVSVSACGSFREGMAPGDFVVVDQFLDRTGARPRSFFGEGCVAHVGFANPTCARLSAACVAAARAAGVRVHEGGTYLAMEGPQFSSLAESNMYRSWGCDVIGMTNMPEAKLAREAEICFATVAMVTDYDCWHPHHDHVDVASVIAVLQRNARHAGDLVKQVIGQVADGAEHGAACSHGCDRVLDTALITAPEVRDAKLLAKLDAVAGRVLKGH